MVDVLILLLFLLSGAATGWLGVDLLPERLLVQVTNMEGLRWVLGGFGAFFGLLAGFFFQQLRRRLMRQVRSMPTDLLISRAVGLILGLLVANLLLAPILLLPLPWEVVLVKPLAAVLSNVFFGVLGYNLAEVHGRTLLRLFNPASTDALLVAEGVLPPATAKILDTSVIIDGRIQGLLGSGLLEGQVIVAQAVIDELQALADSSNNEKRGKGRRGLKLLSGLREEVGRRLVINTTRYEGKGADEKLLQLTADTGGTLLTADYNLAQVARVQELRVVNLSELVIALRPEVQPGDTLQLKIVREGKEADQGVGYLEDGTMVVVEEARKRIGERLPVTVTGALQTPTGRMVFARQERERGKESGERAKETGERSKETGERGKGAAEAARTGGVARGGKGENARGASGAKPIPTAEHPPASSS
ncbi:MAG: TRAM domain-containing protein [Cyanobacteriota bacterium]|nr:TRAM domain-containing protein [Cyanobacteriota bacterium]